MNPATAQAEPTPSTEDAGNWVTATLEAVADTVHRLQSDLPEDARMHDVFEAIRPVLYRLCEFETMAFVSIDSDGLGFGVEALDDWSKRPTVVQELDHQIGEGAFAWALYQSRAPSFVAGRSDRGPSSTRSRRPDG